MPHGSFILPSEKFGDGVRPPKLKRKFYSGGQKWTFIDSAAISIDQFQWYQTLSRLTYFRYYKFPGKCPGGFVFRLQLLEVHDLLVGFSSQIFLCYVCNLVFQAILIVDLNNISCCAKSTNSQHTSEHDSLDGYYRLDVNHVPPHFGGVTRMYDKIYSIFLVNEISYSNKVSQILPPFSFNFHHMTLHKSQFDYFSELN